MGDPTWDGIQGTCPPWLSKLTWVEWHSMWGIYSQVQESRHPQLVYELSVLWAQRGEAVQTGNTVLGWKGLWSLCIKEQEWVADILTYLSLSLLAFESEWQRLQVSLNCLCISVSFKHWDLVWYRYAACLSPLLTDILSLLSVQQWGQLVPPHINVCTCFYHRIVISSQVELSQLLPLFHDILPPSTSHSSSGSSR